MSAKFTYCLIIASLILLAACGTVATPEPFGEPTEVAQAATEEEEVPPPTETPIVPTETNTPIPPTATTAPPEETPEQTEEATVEAGAEDGASGEIEDALTALVDLLGNAEHGDALFHQNQPAVGFACANCHNVDTEERLVGPGLLNVRTRAATRVEGMSAVEYIHTSILAPNSYVVEGFPPNLMPQTYRDVFSDQDLYDIIAYLLTLEG